MPFSAEVFCSSFFDALRSNYEAFRAQQIPAQFNWINRSLIFISLQECRAVVQADGVAEEPWSRFALHPPALKPNDGQANAVAQAAFAQVMQTRQVHHSLNDVPTDASEWLVDFSFSHRKIEEAYGTVDQDPASDFRFLLTAELEIDSRFHKVMEDLIRLFFLSSPVRVMLYREHGQDFRSHFTKMLKAHHHHEGVAKAHWLFLGIPTYREWVAEINTAALPCRVLYLAPEQDPDALENHDEWWG